MPIITYLTSVANTEGMYQYVPWLLNGMKKLNKYLPFVPHGKVLGSSDVMVNKCAFNPQAFNSVAGDLNQVYGKLRFTEDLF